MTDLTAFNYQDHPVRTVLIDNEPHFVAKDIMTVLGLSNPTEAMRGLDEDEFRTTELIDSLGRDQNTFVVTESGMYSLVLRSRKPEAKAFKRWITHEVLPSIRKKGSYGAAHPDMLTRADLARMVIESEEEKARVAAQLEAAAPKVAYHDRYVANDDAVTVGVWAAQFGVSEPQARQLMVEKKVIYKKVIGERWSAKKQAVVKEYEYRAYAGFLEWFDLRPQHNAPRHHNGQVRQTLYVRQECALELGRKVGVQPLAVQAELLTAAEVA